MLAFILCLRLLESETMTNIKKITKYRKKDDEVVRYYLVVFSWKELENSTVSCR
jgi:hypothetical protein